MKLKRMTIKNNMMPMAAVNCSVCGKSVVAGACNKMGCYETAVNRLAAIEDILGAEYSLDTLREVWPTAENPQDAAHWKKHPAGIVLCSKCGEQPLIHRCGETEVLSAFCPHCGARMVEKGEPNG